MIVADPPARVPYPCPMPILRELRRLRAALLATLDARDSLTPDLGGTGTTASFARAIAARATA